MRLFRFKKGRSNLMYVNPEMKEILNRFEQRTKNFLAQKGLKINKVQGRQLLSRVIDKIQPQQIILSPRTKRKKMVIEFEFK